MDARHSQVFIMNHNNDQIFRAVEDIHDILEFDDIGDDFGRLEWKSNQKIGKSYVENC